MLLSSKGRSLCGLGGDFVNTFFFFFGELKWAFCFASVLALVRLSSFSLLKLLVCVYYGFSNM